MSEAAFDTHAYFKRLTSAGMPEAQAEVQAETLSGVLAQHNGNLATKSDVAQVKSDIAQVKSDIAQVKQELKQDMKLLESRMTVKVGAMVFTAFGLAVAVLRMMG
ncbi:MAG: CCDC90 family protein [Alphaproteobacteria bacterium]|nr:CCDC90 family protein [Alphaproteobacteria bacterium]MDA8031185.1 CCDC90 family protein [Alphaproteobacteria bacterium]